MKIKSILVIIFLAVFTIVPTGCSEDDPSSTIDVLAADEVRAEDFTIDFEEFPKKAQLIGVVNAKSGSGELFFTLNSESPFGAISLDNKTGELFVSSQVAFDRTKNTVIKAEYSASNGINTATAKITINVVEIDIQGRLDKGETPLEIYQSNNELEWALYGKKYKGGIIYDFNKDGSGKVATTDLGTYQWGCKGTKLNSSTSDFETDAVKVTNSILSGCKEINIAAKICVDSKHEGYSDWYLPTRHDVTLIWGQLHMNGKYKMPTGRFWTCIQKDADRATSMDFHKNNADDALVADSKDELRHVIGVKSFNK